MGSPERKRGVPFEGLQIILIVLTVIFVNLIRKSQGEGFANTFVSVLVGLVVLAAVGIFMVWRKRFRQFRSLPKGEQDKVLLHLDDAQKWELLTSLGRELEAVETKIEPEVFNISRGYKLQMSVMFWLMLSVSVMILAAITMKPPNTDRSWIIAIGLLAFMSPTGAFAFFMRRRSNQHVEINDEGISQVFNSGKVRSMNWQEIARAIDRPLLRRIDLHGADGTSFITIKYQLVNFHKLRAIVLAKTGLKC